MSGDTSKRSRQKPHHEAASLFGEESAACSRFNSRIAKVLGRSDAPEFAKPYFAQLSQFVAKERTEHQVFPPEPDVYNAFRYTPLDKVKRRDSGARPVPESGSGTWALFLGAAGCHVARVAPQHLQGTASGPRHPAVEAWLPRLVGAARCADAERVLTVRRQAELARGQGVGDVHRCGACAVNELPHPVVFLLWGAYAQKKSG